MQPYKRAKRAALGRRSFARVLVGKKSFLDAARQRFAYAQLSPDASAYKKASAAHLFMMKAEALFAYRSEGRAPLLYAPLGGGRHFACRSAVTARRAVPRGSIALPVDVRTPRQAADYLGCNR